MTTTEACTFTNVCAKSASAVDTTEPLVRHLTECERTFGFPRARQFEKFFELSDGRFIKTFAFAPASESFPSRQSAFFFTFKDGFASGRFFEDFEAFFDGAFFENHVGV